MNGTTILDKLDTAPWRVTGKTYGNSHSTLIGMLVNWWGQLSDTHFVLESGPTNGLKGKGKRGQCDALFCRNENRKEEALGVLKVEGTRRISTIHKVGSFFDAQLEQYETLSFAIVLFYSYEVKGRGEARRFDPVFPDHERKEVVSVTQRHPGKAIIVVTLEKQYERLAGLRSWNEYYRGQTKQIDGWLFQGGKEITRRELYRCPL